MGVECFHMRGYYFHKINFQSWGVTHFVINGCGMSSHEGLLFLQNKLLAMRCYLICNELVWNVFTWGLTYYAKKWVWEFLSIRGSIFSNKIRGVQHLVNYLDSGCQNIKITKIRI